jgi:hypothetical protein
VPTRLETLVNRQIDDLFERAKQRLLGPKWGPKRVTIAWRPDLSLPGVFAEAAREEGGRPSERLFSALSRQASAFLEAQKLRAKARATSAVRSWLQDAAIRGASADPATVLGGELGAIWKDAAVGVAKIFEGEGQVAKNVAIQDAIVRASALAGTDDPSVYFAAPLDEFTCRECRRLHFVRDGKVWSPRVWRMSDLKAGYAKRGDEAPSVNNQHPGCRGILTAILPGYGFVNGSLEYVAAGHDELGRQKKLAL